ncbi:MAG: hypothetical protein E6I93_17890 [Chloroflexi bacterium]|jgi:hypothetical protein|nr:MAG: hypothetical protein E6I93_17890 [Chloroflexota bacterium]
MQRVSLRKITSSVYHVQHTDEEILHYSLEELLPAGQTLALNVLLGTLSLIAYDIEMPYPRMMAEQQFTLSELSLLLPLLNSHPHYCPYEVLLASFNHRTVSDATIERCRRQLHEAQLEGVWDQEMRPVRNVLSRTRLKMRTFGIEIASILETGYVLMRLSARKQLGA